MGYLSFKKDDQMGHHAQPFLIPCFDLSQCFARIMQPADQPLSTIIFCLSCLLPDIQTNRAGHCWKGRKVCKAGTLRFHMTGSAVYLPLDRHWSGDSPWRHISSNSTSNQAVRLGNPFWTHTAGRPSSGLPGCPRGGRGPLQQPQSSPHWRWGCSWPGRKILHWGFITDAAREAIHPPSTLCNGASLRLFSSNPCAPWGHRLCFIYSVGPSHYLVCHLI